MGSTVYDCIPVDDCFPTCMKDLDVFLDKAAGREWSFPGEPSVISRPRNNTNADWKRMAFGLTETLPRITDSYISLRCWAERCKLRAISGTWAGVNVGF